MATHDINIHCDYAIVINGYPCRLDALLDGTLYEEDINSTKLETFRDNCEDAQAELLAVTDVGGDRPIECYDDDKDECHAVIEALESVLGEHHLWIAFRCKTVGGALSLANILNEAVNDEGYLIITGTRLFSVNVNGVPKTCLYVSM